MAQLYFAWTVQMVIRKKWLTCVIILVAATGLGGFTSTYIEFSVDLYQVPVSGRASL